MKAHENPTAVLRLALAVALLVGLSACGGNPVPIPAPDLDTDGIVIITNSRANVPMPRLSPITGELVGQALQQKLPVAVISADGTPAPVNLDIPSLSGCNNEHSCSKHLKEAVGYVAMAVTAVPDSDDANAYGAFAVARDTAKARKLTNPTIICLLCGIDTEGALDMTGEGRLGADSEAHLEYLTSTGQLVTFDDGFDKVTVILTSTGATAPPQTALSPSDVAHLTAVWSEVLAAGGATVTVDPNPASGDPIDTEHTVPAVEVPPPPAPPKPQVTPACTPVELSFDGASDARFEPETDEWVDVDAAREALRPTAEWLQETPTRTARVLGTTADILSGSPKEGIELSTKRAKAAAKLLRELGVSAKQIIEVKGLGPHYDGKVADRDADGNPIPALRTKNRKVIVEIAEQC